MLRKLKNIFHLFESISAAVFFRFPSKKLTVIGVTGTDGKTTTTTLIHHILTTAGLKAGLSSTLMSAHTTTPGRWRVQKFLWQSVKNNCTHAVLEVTSIAVDQHRIRSIDFAVGVLTNIANNEHLDYHHSFESYRLAKLKFLKMCPKVVLNADDSSFNFLKENLPGKEVVPYKLDDWAKLRLETKLVGNFNKSNILAAVAAANLLGIDKETIKRAVASFEPPSGRLEVVVRKPFTVIVDFAHTPQAFAAVLPVARFFLQNKKKNKLIHVFGATGDRDKTKRPIMAQIASQFDDIMILTHEDTYSEDKDKIISDLEKGIDTVKHIKLIHLVNTDQSISVPKGGIRGYLVINDRRRAVEEALKLAKSGDVVILTGVGHQRSMNLGGREVPWNEPALVKEFVNGKGH